ncbi:MAG: peptidoglycan DD-metalloendopeptidase family protein [Rhodospirillales bacterium]|nr:peptidoglycan DD-metalloendopeptidase family protein [Rhodospirillales bacterium]MBT4041488.1 peptidoglycan DD-metalloendopeptidase family protein [Rhodospirillales bacterium]MBT4625720.1 peptidoglycan DD-metalloendopeptidase family protein [Rhodospirillales bacterium]MBT5352386.1 peptidoglycan DD-metalloendopeptidase family protein [Rhodospirillales bacterium]MBT5520591.1 peptidoglycan DD-metalloendopeptidase family protein [Rhodospirillales bacterium]
MQQRSRAISIKPLWALVLFVSFGLGSWSDARAQDVSSENLSQVEKALALELEQSESLHQRITEIARETATLRAKLVTSAKAVQDHEHMIASLEGQLADLEQSERDKVARLATRRKQFAGVLMALERLARFPPEAMIAQPGSPADTVRSALLLRSVVPEIEAQAAELGREVDSLARAREQIEVRRESLWRETVGLEEEGLKLGALLAQKKLLKQQTDAESYLAEQRASELAKEASDLRDLIARIQADKAARTLNASETAMATVVPPSKPTAGDSQSVENETQVAALNVLGNGILSGGSIRDMKGNLPFPVIGKVVAKYGETNENGMTQRGLEVKTRPGAQVIASFEGTVVFVGDFRGYGQLLIIEHSGGYHSLLAGMTRIDSVMGQQVLTGEPVGVMGGDAGSSTDQDAILYVELRREGQSINPSSWLSSRTSTQG